MIGLIHFVFLTGVLIFGLLWNQTPGAAEWPDAEFETSTTNDSTRDVAGTTEQELGAAVALELSFPLRGFDIDTDYHSQGRLERKRHVSFRDLCAEIDGLHPGATKDVLETSVDLVGVILETIESDPGLSIEALEDYTEEVIDIFKDAILPCLEGAQGELGRRLFGSVWVKAKALQSRYKALEYMMGKVRLYARPPARSLLTELLRRAVVTSSRGDETGYTQVLVRLLIYVAEERGMSIKREEADRIRGKADSLLRSSHSQGCEETVRIDLEAEVAGIFLDGALSSQWTHALAPSEEREVKGFTLRAEWENEVLKSALDVATSGMLYSDRLNWDKDENDYRVKLALEQEDTFELSTSWEKEEHPRAFDDEIEAQRVSEAATALRSLIASIEGATLNSDLKDELIEQLSEQGALGALLQGARGDAVKEIEGFIEFLHDEVWEGEIETVTAERWIIEAEEILPRQREYRLDLPAGATWPLLGGALSLALEWEREVHPAASARDRLDVTREFVYESTGDEIELEASFEQVETVYPYVEGKDKVVREWAFKVDSGTDFAVVELDYSNKTTVYPFQSSKDKSIQKLEVSCAVSFPGLTLQAAQEDEWSHYPSDRNRPDEKRREVSVDLAGTVGDVTFEISSTRVDRYRCPSAPEETLVRKERVLEFKIEFEISDLTIFSDLRWEKREDWEDVTDEEDGLWIEVGCTAPLLDDPS